MNRRHFWLCNGLMFAPAAFAASPGVPAQAASSPAAVYESVFATYRSYREPPLAEWREVNGDVARAGGHIGIMRESTAQPGASEAERAAAAERESRTSGAADATHRQ